MVNPNKDRVRREELYNIKKILNNIDKNLEYMYRTGRSHYKKNIIIDTDNFIEELRRKWIRCKTEVLQ